MKTQLTRINEFLDSVGIDSELEAQSGMVSLSGGKMHSTDAVNSGCINKANCSGANVNCVNYKDNCGYTSNEMCMIHDGGEMNQSTGCK